jgi:hypothetical protein
VAGGEKRPSPLLLGVLIVALVALAYLRRDLIFGGGNAASGGAERGITLDAKVEQLKTLPEIALMRPAEGESYAPTRNLFDYSKSPELIELDRQRREAEIRAEKERQRLEEVRRKEEERRREEERLHPKPPPPPPPPPEPVPPSFGYSYIGYLGPSGRTGFMAVLIKRGGPGKAFPARVGDTLDNAFVVKKIDFDSVVVGYVDTRFGERTETVRLVAPVKSGK